MQIIFNITFFQNLLLGITLECQAAGIQIRPEVLLVQLFANIISIYDTGRQIVTVVPTKSDSDVIL